MRRYIALKIIWLLIVVELAWASFLQCIDMQKSTTTAAANENLSKMKENDCRTVKICAIDYKRWNLSLIFFYYFTNFLNEYLEYYAKVSFSIENDKEKQFYHDLAKIAKFPPIGYCYSE